jgi:hypothetical protein
LGPRVNVDVHIERLIVDGLPLERIDGAVLQAAVAAELHQAIIDGSMLFALHAAGAFARMPGGTVDVGEEGNLAHLGRQVARAIYTAISGPR